MKKFILIGALALMAFGAFAYVRSQQGSVILNEQHVRLVLLKKGYRCYGLDYSHGFQLQTNGKQKNLWHWPKWHHRDLRPFWVDCTKPGPQTNKFGKVVLQ